MKEQAWNFIPNIHFKQQIQSDTMVHLYKVVEAGLHAAAAATSAPSPTLQPHPLIAFSLFKDALSESTSTSWMDCNQKLMKTEQKKNTI